MKSISKVFFQGFITLLPLALTIYILYSAIIILENLLGGVLRSVMPTYIPGLGFILILVLIYLFGLMLNHFVTSRLLSIIEEKLQEIPFIKAIYSPLRDVMNLFSKKENNGLQSVVLVKMQDGIESLGVVTREQFQDLNIATTGKIAVYFPFSYALGGFTLLIDKKNVTPVDIPIEKAMSLAITAWVKAEKEKKS